jgi:hypothetical protein
VKANSNIKLSNKRQAKFKQFLEIKNPQGFEIIESLKIKEINKSYLKHQSIVEFKSFASASTFKLSDTFLDV